MKIENRVRRIYERHPYPPLKLRAAAKWTLPAPDWIAAMTGTAEPLAPKRVLVAGCGVGTEAFAATAKFPEAEVKPE